MFNHNNSYGNNTRKSQDYERNSHKRKRRRPKKTWKKVGDRDGWKLRIEQRNRMVDDEVNVSPNL